VDEKNMKTKQNKKGVGKKEAKQRGEKPKNKDK